MLPTLKEHEDRAELTWGLSRKESVSSAGDTRERVPSLCPADPLEEKMATPPAFLPGESHGQRSLAGYSP